MIISRWTSSRWISSRCLSTVMTLAFTTLLAYGSARAANQEESAKPSTALDVARQDYSNKLKGTWRVTITLKNCATGAQLGVPFHSRLTFAGDKTVIGTTANPAFLPGQRTPDLGIWTQTGRDTYSALTEALVVFAGGPFSEGVQTIRHNIQLSDHGDTFSDDATVTFTNFDGVQVPPMPNCAAAVAQRVQ